MNDPGKKSQLQEDTEALWGLPDEDEEDEEGEEGEEESNA